MRSAVIAGVALIVTALPSFAQNTNPTQPGAATPPAMQPQTPPATQPATPPALTQPATPPAAQRTAPAVPSAQAQPARMEGSHLIGLTLRNPANESIGEIDDVIVDADGRVRQVVVGVGGFLGIGEHKVAIAWDQLRFDRDVAMVNLTKDQLRAMPEYRATRTMPNTAPNAAPGTPGATTPSRTAPNPAPGTRQP